MNSRLLHAICWTTSERSAAEVQGPRGQALERVEVGDLTAWATRWSGPRRLERDDILAVHALVSSLGDVLPVRLPTWFEDEDTLRAAVSSHRAELVAALEQVSGRVEFGITLRWRHAPKMAASEDARRMASGREYLLARQNAFKLEAARRARAEVLQTALMRRISEASVAVEHRVCPSPHVALSSAVLAQREMAPSLLARLNDFGQGDEDVRILVHGPWPPYTFAHIPTISS